MQPSNMDVLDIDEDLDTSLDCKQYGFLLHMLPLWHACFIACRVKNQFATLSRYLGLTDQRPYPAIVGLDGSSC